MPIHDRLVAPGEPGLVLRCIDVYSFLPRQHGDGGHDLFGQLARLLLLGLLVGSRRENRSTYPDLDTVQARHDVSDRLHAIGSDHRDRDDGYAGEDRHPRNSGLASVEPTIWASGAFGVDTEQSSTTHRPGAGLEGGRGGIRVLTVDGDEPGSPNEGGLCAS